jgi:hypothetical protein
MAVATLIITDVDLEAGQVEVKCEVEGSLIDDGQMTAAEVMIRVLHNEINNPTFRNKIWSEVAKMTADVPGVQIANDDQCPEKAMG